MKLVEAQVSMFRNVVDSGPIRIQDDVTCLVGKNESGKTSLLVALHRLNPANGTGGFSAQEDYPRWRLSRDRKAGADMSAVKADEFDSRRGELEAVSNELTQQVFEYWTQSPNLSVEIDSDKETVTSGPYNGQTAIVKYLEVRVKDSRHGFTGNFEQRSTGFQWFFSFFAAFSEFEDLGHDVIVLLDEPAMSLHGRAQADFLRFINERLGAKSQVIYTTHSPFMIEPNRLERVRIVEDLGPQQGAAVTEDVHRVGDDATFPLQAALGYDIAQNLFIGPDNLLLEGGSDQTYLRIMSDHLRAEGREGLDDRWRVVSTQRNEHAGVRLAV